MSDSSIMLINVTFFCIVIVMMLIAHLRRVRRAQRERQRHLDLCCPQCNYNRTGCLESTICPECGATLDDLTGWRIGKNITPRRTPRD